MCSKQKFLNQEQNMAGNKFRKSYYRIIIRIKGTSNNSFTANGSDFEPAALSGRRNVFEKAIVYACGDFDLSPKPGKISHVLVTNAIFRGFLLY